MWQSAAVTVRNVSKRFGGVEALRDVSINVVPGEIVGLVGENGAGKSTLLNVMSGVVTPDSGDMLVSGRSVIPKNYREANRLGIFRVHQEPALVDTMSVAENVFLGYESHLSRFGLIGKHGAEAQVSERLMETALGRRVSPKAKTGSLSMDRRTLVEITRALTLAELLEIEAPTLLLDEPTASLTREEVDYLFSLMVDMKRHAGFVFVSHRLEEVLKVSDRIYVMKDGRVVAELDPHQASTSELHRLMVGRVRESAYYHDDQRPSEIGPPLLEAHDLSAPPYFLNISLVVRAAEILGIAGIEGSGKNELGRALIGDLRTASGRLTFAGRRVERLGIRKRINGGFGYVPLDRHAEGVILYHSIRTNLPLAALQKIAHAFGLLSRRKESEVAESAIKHFRIAAPNADALVGSLSGGNQQKVLLARCVVAGSRVLILDNPTRGVDVGAKTDIYAHLRTLTRTGIGVVLISDDLHELIGVSDRILVMKDGHMVAELGQVGGLEEHQLVGYMV